MISRVVPRPMSSSRRVSSTVSYAPVRTLADHLSGAFSHQRALVPLRRTAHATESMRSSTTTCAAFGSFLHLFVTPVRLLYKCRLHGAESFGTTSEMQSPFNQRWC